MSEWGGVNDDNGVLDEGLGSDPLVVGGVVHNVDDPGLAGDALGPPGEVPLVQTQSAVLLIAWRKIFLSCISIYNICQEIFF